MLAYDFLDKFTIFNVAFVEGTKFGGPAMTGTEVVEYDRFPPGLGEQFTSMASDITSSASDQNRTWQDVLTMPQSTCVGGERAGVKMGMHDLSEACKR